MNAITAASKLSSRRPNFAAFMTTLGTLFGASRIIPSATSAPTTKAFGARSRISASKTPTPAPTSSTLRASASGIRSNRARPGTARIWAQ
jgi:hypothetical protein